MIREYNEKDIQTVFNIWYQASTIAHPFLNSVFVEKAKKDMYEIYIPNSKTWVFEEDEIVVGFIGMMGNEIGGLFVYPQHQSKGIGTKLVGFISNKFDELEVEVFKKNKKGRAFYDKYGFKLMNEYVHEETGEGILRMKFTKSV